MLKLGKEEHNIKLSVQYFAKPAGGSGDPRQVTTKHITLSVLDAQPIYVDLPPVAIESVSRTLSGARRDFSKTSGDKFYGYIVTVLSHDNTVLYQGVTTGGLRKLATSSTVNKPADSLRLKRSPTRLKRLGR